MYEDLLADKVPGGRREALGAEKSKRYLTAIPEMFLLSYETYSIYQVGTFPKFYIS